MGVRTTVPDDKRGGNHRATEWSRRHLRAALTAAMGSFAKPLVPATTAPPGDGGKSAEGGRPVASITSVGLLPAVYLPHVRMAAVLFDWTNAEERRIAFNWEVTAALPPPTCFVSTFRARAVTLSANVARAVSGDGFVAGAGPWYSAALDLWIGAVSWWEGCTDVVHDLKWLRQAGMAATTVLYFLDRRDPAPSYVPLLYLQSHLPYEGPASHTPLLAALGARDSDAAPAGAAPPDSVALEAAVAVCHAASLRAREWLNPKTELLSDAGFKAVRRDVAERVEKDGRLYAEVFFDIDNFKALNDELGYTLADDIAREVARRALGYLHGPLIRDCNTATEHGGPEPDQFAGFLCHVSGDEFKFFFGTPVTRTAFRPSDDPTVAQTNQQRIADLRDFLEGLVRAVSGRGDLVPWLERQLGGPLHPGFERLVRRAGAAVPPPAYLGPPQELTAENAARLRSLASRRGAAAIGFPANASRMDALFGVTISVGAAVLGVSSEAVTRHDTRPVVLGALEDLDTLAERALDGAKKRGRNRVLFFDELLRSGGIVTERLAHQVRLSLGEADGVRRGSTFDVMELTSATDASRVAAEAERRAFHTSGWVARVEVHDVWPREALAHVTIGRAEDIATGYWLRAAGPDDDHSVMSRATIGPPPAT